MKFWKKPWLWTLVNAIETLIIIVVGYPIVWKGPLEELVLPAADMLWQGAVSATPAALVFLSSTEEMPVWTLILWFGGCSSLLLILSSVLSKRDRALGAVLQLTDTPDPSVDPPTMATMFGAEVYWGNASSELGTTVTHIDVRCPDCLISLERRASSPWRCVGCQKEYQLVPDEPQYVRMHVEGLIRRWERNQYGGPAKSRPEGTSRAGEPNLGFGFGFVTEDTYLRQRLRGRPLWGDRFQISQRQGNRCAYCGKGLDMASLHIDQIIPVPAGGTNHYRNLQAVCPVCNLRKGSQTDEEFRRRHGFYKDHGLER